MNNNSNIGVFDSGVGGTTVLKEILKVLPHENILYYGDSGNAPYGQKSTEEIQKLCCRILDFFIANNCKAVVVACNTATAAALDKLKNTYSIPIIGVISAGVKGALKVTKNNKINILATPFTVDSNAYIKELRKHFKSFKITQEGCPEFCPMIEIGWETHPDRYDILKSHISHLSQEADTLILGCTHYPIIKNDIKRFFSGNIVDPARETALELYSLLRLNDLLNTSSKIGKVEFFVTGDKKLFKKIAEQFLEFEIKNIYQIDK